MYLEALVYLLLASPSKSNLRHSLLMVIPTRWIQLLCLTSTTGFTSLSHRIPRGEALRLPRDEQTTATKALPFSLSAQEQELAFWTVSFASTHIGISAIRNIIIDKLGRTMEVAGVVNSGVQLPAVWPGDALGNQVWPTSDSAGRQVYRLLYTMVSFGTLGNALACYLQEPHVATTDSPFFWMAVLSNTASLTSLANASPLGLMPGFDQDLQRNDNLKYQVRGLTRITRHPLILPVVPWGIANVICLGGHSMDWILWGGLSLYAVLGCAAQDLRVSRQEGSVGTSFDSFEQLQDFYDSTSFLPFGAVVDGRQELVLQEIPWVAVLMAAPVGYVIEKQFLELLGSM